MTNADIIFSESIKLMEAGKIGTTGRTITMECADGSTMTFSEPEAIHTFAHWKSLGFSVKKGERAVAKFPIWKAVKPKKDDSVIVEEKTKMFMKVSAWFSQSQVEAM